MDNQDLSFLSAAELGRLIASRQVSPVDATEACLSRIQQLDGKLHAYITVSADQAIAAARDAEQAITSGNYLGPIHGVPVAVKDQIWTKGIPTTNGSTVLKDFVPDQDATVVANLKRSGAILLGKLNMTEFAMAYTYHYPYGTPANPWDLARMPGGSSAGSGSAPAAGLCAVALGEDTVGSVRWPATYCGVAGLRPSWGRVSRHGLMGATWSMDTVGPLARSVEDCALTLHAMAGHDVNDPFTSHSPVPDYAAELNRGVQGLRIGVVTEMAGWDLVDPEIRSAFDAAIDELSDLGASVREVSFPSIRQAGAIAMPISLVESAAVNHHYIRDRIEEFDYNQRINLLSAAVLPAQTYYKVQRLRQLYRDEALGIMRDVDLLAYPAHPTPAPPIIDTPGLGSREQFKVDLFGRRSFNFPASLMGAPALSTPCGFTQSGLPIAFQLVGRPKEDATVLRAGHAYQQATDWHIQRPPL